MSSVLLFIVSLVVLDQSWQRREKLGFPWWIGAAACAVGVTISAALLPSMLYLQKIVALLLMPIGLLWCGLWCAAGFLRARGQNRAALVATGFALFLSVAANPWLGRTLLAQLEAPYASVDPFEEGPFEAVFVLGGGTSVDGAGNPILGGSGDRVMLGARMWHSGRTKHLVASGSSIGGIGTSRDVARETELIWESIDVPEEHVTVLAEPKNTSQEVAAYAALARERGYETVGIVTSAWHLRRTMARAKAEGLEAVPLPADFRGGRGFDGPVSLVPSGFGARDMHRACWEWLGELVGR